MKKVEVYEIEDGSRYDSASQAEDAEARRMVGLAERALSAIYSSGKSAQDIRERAAKAARELLAEIGEKSEEPLTRENARELLDLPADPDHISVSAVVTAVYAEKMQVSNTFVLPDDFEIVVRRKRS